jgi:hypothetical protein
MNDFNNPLREVCSTVNISMDADIGTVSFLAASSLLNTVHLTRFCLAS